MKRLFGANPLALIAAIAFLQIAVSSCSNPSNAPASSTTVSYSASAFFNTESAGDTSTTPFPFCFPVEYLKEKLNLTDSQVTTIQQIQDSLRLALAARINALKAVGTLTLD